MAMVLMAKKSRNSAKKNNSSDMAASVGSVLAKSETSKRLRKAPPVPPPMLPIAIPTKKVSNKLYRHALMSGFVAGLFLLLATFILWVSIK